VTTSCPDKPSRVIVRQFGVIVLGYDSYDSYAYPGGLDQKQINPQ
jgi:hypothetical protein